VSVVEPLILLRHDIDFSLDLLVPLLRIEQELGLVSTVFLRPHSSGYNPFAFQNYALLSQLNASGCEIGLHYEPLFAQLTREEPDQLLLREKQYLEAAVGQSVRGLVQHSPRLAPAIADHHSDVIRRMGFTYEATEPMFTIDSFYISDANQYWKRGCPCRHLGYQPRITLLIHPIWWSGLSSPDKYAAIQRLRLAL
jgi:hypothetical protein